MYAESSQVSLLGISNSELVVKDGEGIKVDIMERPSLKFHEECCQTTPTSSSSSNSSSSSRRKEEINEEKKKKELNLKEMDDDDGFKTPTSLDQKILEAKQCPPAPRKPKPLKRKASPNNSTNAELTVWNLQLYLSQEVDSLHPRPLQVKKTRTREKQ